MKELYLENMPSWNSYTWKSCHHETVILPNHAIMKQLHLEIMPSWNSYTWKSCHHETVILGKSCHHETVILGNHAIVKQLYLEIMPTWNSYTWKSCHHETVIFGKNVLPKDFKFVKKQTKQKKYCSRLYKKRAEKRFLKVLIQVGSVMIKDFIGMK